MEKKIRPALTPIYAKVNLPGSKSITRRALMLGALADGVSELSGLKIDDEIHNFVNMLQQLGIVCQLDKQNSSCILAGGNGRFPKKQATLWCDKFRTLAILFLSASAISPGVYYFDGTLQLRKRKFSHLLNLLRLQGVQFIPNDMDFLPFTLLGIDNFKGGDMVLEQHGVSSIVSALLLTSPYARAAFTFSIPNLIDQRSIDLTCTMMAEFGVLVHRIHQGQFMVPVPQRYQAKDYNIEPDLFLAAHFFGAAAITGGEITIQLVKRSQAKQIDIKFLSVLEKMGCKVLENHAGLTVQGPKKLQGIHVNIRECTNTFLVLIALAVFAQTPTKILQINTLSPKKMKRLKLMINELTRLGIKIELKYDSIQIFPGTPNDQLINSFRDYRIAMAFALIGLKIPELILDDTRPVMKVYPEFFLRWDELTEGQGIKV